MKKKLLVVTLLAAPALVLFTSGVLDSNGKLGATGGPGAVTCSDVNCHGSGSGGLQDNGGPGSIVITSNPAFTNNQYIPGTVYHMSVVVSETGKGLFGFDFEALDNSGNTNMKTNTAVGTVTITDAVSTRKTNFFGTGRLNVAHQKNGGLAANSKSFNFDWTAPNSGIVNMYAAGIAANNDALSDASDNVYKTTKQLTAGVVNGINAIEANDFSLHTFPNPVNDVLTLKMNIPSDENISVGIYSLEGKLSKELMNQKISSGLFSQTFSTEGMANGVYLLKVLSGDGTINQTQKIIVK